MLEATNPATWETNRQKQLMGEYELESKRRSMDAEQKLRELYSSGGPVSNERVMAINPELGIKMQQFQNDQILKNLQAQETKGKIDLQAADQAAAAAFPALVAYHDNIQRGMPEAQAREKFHAMNGKAVSDAAESGATWLQPGASYDPKKVDPENVRALNARFGRFTPFDKLQQESQTEAMKTGYGIREKMAPSYGDIKPTWDSQRGQWISTPETQAPSFSGASAEELNMIEKSLPGMPEGPDKEGLKRFLAKKKGMPALASQSDIKPMSEVKADEARAVETAKTDVQRTEENKRITESFKRAIGEGGVSRVMKMISESTSGKGEEIAAKARGAIPGVGASPGMENIGALNTIAGELRKTIERSPGPQSDKDVALAALDAAAISDPSIPYNQRMKGFLEFTRIIKERAKDLGIDPKVLGIDVDTSTGSSMPTAKTDEEAERLVKTLKPGDSFIGPDGKTHKIKGL